VNKGKKGRTVSTLQELGSVLTKRLVELQSAEARFEDAKDAHSRALAEVQADAQVEDAVKITLSIERMRKEIDRRHIRPAPYGFRIEGGRATKHLDEMPALRKLLGMRLKGVSLRGIAQWLDEQGVPTRRRGKGWHSQVVKLIADRMIGKKGSRGTKA
jgi:hypothetical protein